jgi:hypothetical protein
LTFADPGAADDAVRLQQTNEQDSVNPASPSAEIPTRALTQATQELAGESVGEGGGRTAPDFENAPAVNCESRQFELEMTSSTYDTLWLDIRAAPFKHLDPLCREVWAQHAAGKLTDGEAQGLAEMIRDRQRPEMACRTRQVVRVSVGLSGTNRPSRRRPPRSPDRRRSLERRRRLSAAGLMPPGIACKLTLGERAALYIVAMEVRARGQCNLYVDAVAGRAGVSRSTVKNALRMAKRLGLITVDERRIGHRYNDSNRVRIVSWEWLVWLAHGRKETVKNLTTTSNQYFNPGKFCRVERPKVADRTRGEARAVPKAGP